MISLPGEKHSVFRAYSIASPCWDDELEFFSIKVSGGPLTEELQKIRKDDPILVGTKPTGTLVCDSLIGGKRLYMFSTGTGIAPFASLIRDPETYEKFEQLILTHTCRQVGELQYGYDVVGAARLDPLIGDLARERLIHYATATREPYARTGRITELLTDGKLFEDIGAPPLSPERDRAMICGSMDMIRDTKALLNERGFDQGSNARPSSYVVERAFVG